MATIKAIERQTVHQIQSGQVIVDLCSVVKELVENSLDAGATSIDVRFKNQGLDAIEVQDNGSGISPDNYGTLALKHYTSKLATYSDLTSLETFGFRGEALSSLCALSNFTVTTCLAADVPKGTKLEYETSGKLRGTAVVAAQKGTCISVEQLFKNLPVRRRELERNIKREWNRVISVLNQYACIQAGVKLSVSQQPTKGKRITLFSTKGNKTTRENIVNVFGAKTLTVLIPLDLKLELEPSKTPLHLRNTADTNPTSATTEIHVRGHVSRPAHGEGRQTPDRQMFFVNGRPCGLPQFAKVFNEVYKAYNASQSPFICADIQLDTHLYDVNVSPDKRTILLHEQPRMLDNLREALVQLFEAHDYAVPTSTLAGGTQTPYKKPLVSRENTISSFRRDQSQSAGDSTTEPEYRPSPGKVISEGAAGEPSEAQSTPDSKSEMKSIGASFISQFTRSAPGIEDSTTDDSPEQLPLSQQTEEMSAETPADDKEDHGIDVEQLENLLPTIHTESITQRGPQSPIPTVAAPTHTAGTNTSQISVPSRSKRPAPELATITIGDSTVTSILGEPYKRAKTGADSSETTRAKANKKATSDVPSFQGRLSQMFAASAQKSQSSSRLSRVPTSAQDGEDEEESDAESEQLFVHDEDDIMSQSEGDESAVVDETMMSGARSLADAAISGGDSPASATDARSMGLLTDDGQSVHGSDEEAVEGAGSEYDDEQMQDAVEDEDREVVETEETPGQSLEEANKRTQTFMKGSARKYATRQLQQTLRITESHLYKAMVDYSKATSQPSVLSGGSLPAADKLDADDAEAKLSLTISKADFLGMKIIGQFNLGFIIAVREGSSSSKDNISATARRDDELFIIDQHATDEKYNFERLQASTVVQSQRLVQPKQLDLTALEEEVIKENIGALEANGFQVDIDESGYHPVGQRVRLLSLPLSRETTFDLVDLEELVSLLTDHHEVSAPAVSSSTSLLSGGGSGGVIPRPSKVRKMFAMRACRSSVMIGKSLTHKQMERLVRHMGELDKPWNCPHGRPTMRHLCGLAGWEGMGWKEGSGDGGAGQARGGNERTDWAAYLRG